MTIETNDGFTITVKPARAGPYVVVDVRRGEWEHVIQYAYRGPQDVTSFLADVLAMIERVKRHYDEDQARWPELEAASS